MKTEQYLICFPDGDMWIMHLPKGSSDKEIIDEALEVLKENPWAEKVYNSAFFIV